MSSIKKRPTCPVCGCKVSYGESSDATWNVDTQDWNEQSAYDWEYTCFECDWTSGYENDIKWVEVTDDDDYDED